MQLTEREKEINALGALASIAASQRGQLVLVAGEAGIGKSALLETFVGQLPSAPKILWGYCDDLLTPRPFGPVFDLAQGLGSRVAGLMQAGVAGAELFPEVLGAISALPQGSILIIEDVHWADHATIDLLRYLARRIVSVRSMIVLTFRPDEILLGQAASSLFGNLPANLTTRFDLNPLSAEGVAQLARNRGVVAEGLYEVTGGNPFFVSEVLAQPPKIGLGLPASVRDAVVARLNKLDEGQRRFLEALSVVPEPVQRDWVEAIFGTSTKDICNQCIEMGQLSQTPDNRIRFRHELARLGTLSTVDDRTQRDLHRRYLQYHQSNGGTTSLSLLVHHAHALGDGQGVLNTAPHAAAEAARLGAHNEAADFLASALTYLDLACPETAAQLLEDWAYEAGLVLQMGDDVIAARHRAIDLWQELGRPDKVGLNLRWLWRLHWYRGETEKATAAADQAIAVLESIVPSKELGMAYSMRSQVYFLNSMHQQAITWGERALAIASRFEDVETRIHAMTNIATTSLLNGDHTKRPMMEEALALARTNGLHEHAARVYTNYSEYAILVRDWELAERLTTEGLAFDAKHNLDSWTYYLVGRQAQLRLDQGRLEEAAAIARGALSIERLTAVMRVPALTSLAIAESRLGLPEAEHRLDQALALALDLKEPQNIIPVRFGLLGHYVLQGDLGKARDQLSSLLAGDPSIYSPWDSAQLRVWGQRLGVKVPQGFGTVPLPAQEWELQGDWLEAARLLDNIGTPMEVVFVALFAPSDVAGDLLVRAIDICGDIGSRPGNSAIRGRADDLGLAHQLPRPKRGPYKAVRNHPLGLSGKEVEVLTLMIEGANNAEIAAKVNRSRRTIEHHVSAILAKLGANNRLGAILRTLSEPWIVAG
jgi:DNA-binding CsgD family transcriptional regulator/tetratricopeptide (TPR) repeat protein